MTENNLQEKAMELASRPYTLFVFLDETTDSGTVFVAMNPDLPGCIAQGDSAEEAESILSEVRTDYMAHRLVHALPIPEPGLAREQSGRLSDQAATARVIRPVDGETLRPQAQVVELA
jgi:predicted RNase H-like HicB family nuclease